MTDPPAPGSAEPSKIDTSVPHSARIWNYWLGGRDNYPVDQEIGAQYRETFPGIVDVARTSRYFLARAVRYLAGEAGIRQFLDVGTGLPTVDHTHEVAQRVAPDARIVYVDNDPLVLVHARALLTSSPRGTCDYIEADLREPADILAAAAEKLDFSQPVALMLMGIMGHIPDEEAYPVVGRLVAGLPSGSYLALYDGANVNAEFNDAQNAYNDSGAVPYHLRSPERIARFFGGLELLEPGVVPTAQWRPDPSPFDTPDAAYTFGAVARKP
jgi:O-methyltransferase involved in polyketide biosynthesis